MNGPELPDPDFTLAVMTSADGFIARHGGHPTHVWASAEEQVLFMAAVEAADWAVMGRVTHEAADKPQRRRIIFSRGVTVAEWRRPTQVWTNPQGQVPAGLARLVSGVHPLRRGLILGGTTVHDWFRVHGAIARIDLTVEPLTFGFGLPVFTGQMPGDPLRALAALGFHETARQRLNAAGTTVFTLSPST